MKIIPVILCGGSGTRLWPLSRSGFPKQFLVLTGEKSQSLFQMAVERIVALVDAPDGDKTMAMGSPLIVTNEEHRFLALEQLREIGHNEALLLLEPMGRNTAPAMSLAALQAMSEGDDPILVVTPADQTIVDTDAFIDTLQKAVKAAAAGATVVLGIKPNRPETGYGYIKKTGAVGVNGEYAVAQFTEKPDIKTATEYCDSDDFTWNSGSFVVKASVWLKSLGHFREDIAEATEKAWLGRTADKPFIRPDKNAFAAIPNESVDYAVMEQYPHSDFAKKHPIVMLPLDAGWSDLGAWDAVWGVGEKDANNNLLQGDVLAVDTKNSLVHATTRLVGTVGINNLVIVETADAVLVADAAQSQHVKKIVVALEKQKRDEHTLHRKVHRPWGWYDSIDESDRFKVKRIQVKPGASLSLQKHHHRAEHWIVVKGTAEVTCGEKVILLTENQSTYIPLGEVHRLANPGTIPLEIIEVQSGSYLGEDDIVRFEDTYGRAQ